MSIGMEAAKTFSMRQIRLTGREVSIVRTIGFAEAMSGTDILEQTRMQPEDVADSLNGMISAGFVESVPYSEEVSIDDLTTTAFEINPAYAGELRSAMIRR
jgi:DNA-binding MarR family transcriptional regulator